MKTNSNITYIIIKEKLKIQEIKNKIEGKNLII